MYCTLLQEKWLLSLLYYDEVKAIIYILPMIAFSMIEYWKIKLVWRVLWSLDFKELLLVPVILVSLIISIIYHLLMTTCLLFKRIKCQVYVLRKFKIHFGIVLLIIIIPLHAYCLKVN